MVRLFRKHPRTSAAALGSLLALGILVGAEVGLRGLAAYRNAHHPPAKSVPSTVMDMDPRMGYRAPANATVEVRYGTPEEAEYVYTYHTDEFRRRIIPCPDAAARTQFLLFFGCSFAFGEGVNDDATLPAECCRRLPEFAPYDYGYSGYGPQQMYLIASGDGIERQISQRRGIALYLFIDDHVNRVAGRTTWNQYLPDLVEEGPSLVSRGLFPESRPVRFWLWDTAIHMELGSRFIKRFSSGPRDEDFRKVARIAAGTRDCLNAAFDAVDFYVLIYPKSRFRTRLIPHLDALNVPYLDYTDRFADWTQNVASLRYPDGHPTPLTYRRIAEQLAGDLAHKE